MYIDVFPQFTSSEIQSAMTEASENPQVRGVLFHPGTYNRVADLKLRDNVHLRGFGAHNTIIRPPYAPGRAIRISQDLTRNVQISDLTFQSNGTLSWDNTAISIPAGIENLTIERCVFRGWANCGVAIASVNQARNLRFLDCEVRGDNIVSAAGISICGAELVRVRGCDFYDVARPVSFEGDANRHVRHVWVTECAAFRTRTSTLSASNGGIGVHIQPEDSHVNNVVIAHNQFEDTIGVDIGLLASQPGDHANVVIVGNISTGQTADNPVTNLPSIAISRWGDIVIVGNLLNEPGGTFPHYGIHGWEMVGPVESSGNLISDEFSPKEVYT